MNRLLGVITTAMTLWTGAAAAGSITLYSGYDFGGDSVTLRRDVDNFAHYPPWNDRAVSMVVNSGTWEVCKHAGFRDCKTVRGGAQVGDLGHIGVYKEISSIRELDSFGRRDDRHDRRDPWDWNRHDRDRHDPWDPPRNRDRDRVTWDDPDDGYTLSRCQQRVYDGFVERFGRRGPVAFSGRGDDGTIRWRGDTWRYRCTGGRVHIWQ